MYSGYTGNMFFCWLFLAVLPIVLAEKGNELLMTDRYNCEDMDKNSDLLTFSSFQFHTLLSSTFSELTSSMVKLAQNRHC